MNSVKCVCVIVVCLGALAGLSNASPFSPISKYLPDAGKVLEKPTHVEVPTQDDNVKLTGGVFGLPFKAIESFSGTINDAISSGMGHKGNEAQEHEEKHLGQERQDEKHGEQHEGHGEQHEGHVEQHERHVEQHEGHDERHEGHAEQHEAHDEQHEGRGEHVGEIKEHTKDSVAVLKDIKSKLPTDKASDVVETVVEKVPVESIIRKGEAHDEEEVKIRQRRNLPIPSTRVVNSQPMVEPRYAIDAAESSSGAFLQGAKGIVIDEPDALEQSNRPVIIYVNSCKKINLSSGSDCKNCE